MLPLFPIFTLFDRGRLAASFVFSILMLFDQGSRTVRMRDVPCRALRHICGMAWHAIWARGASKARPGAVLAGSQIWCVQQELGVCLR